MLVKNDAKVGAVPEVLFPDIPLSKQELAEYYVSTWPWAKSYYADRPIVMLRFVHGIDTEPFYHKNVTEQVPSYVHRVEVPTRQKGIIHAIVVRNASTLEHLVHLDCITPHLWLSTTKDLEKPDQLIFDLDPFSEKQFSLVKETAQALRQELVGVDLHPFLKLTGSRGLHVVVPLRRSVSFDTSRAVARMRAERVCAQNEKYLTIDPRLAYRRNKVYIDVIRNSYGVTAVAPYAVRARPHAPIALPIAWDLLEDSTLRSDMVSCTEVAEWVKKHGDPWKGFRAAARSLAPLARQVEE